MVSWSARGLLLVLVATALLYLPALRADFVDLDDYAYVRDNPDVLHPQLTRILNLHTLTVWDWTPVVTLTHAAEYALFGPAPLAYHATNVLLHLTGTALMYFLLLDLGIGAEMALLAALIFAIHPLQVESVAWISSRKNLLAAVFGLGFCRAFLAAQPLLAALLLILALGTKGTAVVFPVWAAAAWALGFGKIPGRQAVLWLAVFGAMACGRGLLSSVVQAPVIVTRSASAMSLNERMSVMGPVLATQLRQFFLPYDLSLRYYWSARAWTDPYVLASWALVASAITACIWVTRRDRRIVLAVVFTVVALLPTLNIIPAPEFQADRYVHLALVGGAVLGIVLVRSLGRIHRLLPGIALVLWCAAIAVPTTWARIAVWRTTESLWGDVLRRNPDDVFAWDSLGRYYLDVGAEEKADVALRRTLELQPGYYETHFNYAVFLSKRGAISEAIAQLRIVLDLQPSYVEGHALLGQLLVVQGQTEEGLKHLDAALGLDPANARARYQGPQLHARADRLDASAQDFEELLRTRPASVIFSGLAAVRLRQGRPAEAVTLAQKATESNAQQAEGWDVLGQALVASNQLEAADVAVTRGLATNPEAADLWYRLAKIRQQRGDRDGARTAAAHALQVVPKNPPSWLSDARDIGG